jgi:hypothetical protein
MGLIGREMFAIDGVKLPSNASKAKSGTRADFQRQADKMEAAAEGHARPPPRERRPAGRTDLAEKDSPQVERLTREAAQMRQWLSDHPDDRKGAKGKVIKSNRTDNESAKMATSKGVIQGYTGVAAVDDRHQIIVEAQAHGTGSEQALLMPVVEAAAPLCTPDTLITADAGYHSDANLKALAEQDRPALIADNQMRKRDERFKDQAKYKAQPDPLYDKAHPKKAPATTGPRTSTTTRRPAPASARRASSLYQNGSNCNHNGHLAVKFQGALRDCGPCTQRDKCLRKPETTKTRQVSFFYGKAPGGTVSYIELMKRAIDSERGRAALWRTLRHGGAGVWQHPPQQGAGSLHAARAAEGGYAVEALLPGAQHREAGASRGMRSRRKTLNPLRQKSALAIRRDRNSIDEMTNGAMRIAPFGGDFAA